MSGSDASQSLIARSALLRQLDTEPKDTDALRETVSLSASTIDRAVCELEDVGYVEQVDGQYQTTLTGRLALELYDQFTTTLDGVRESLSLLTALDPSVSLAPEVVANAAVVRPTRDSPRAHIERSATILDDADRIRTIISDISPAYIELYHDRIMDGVDVSLVVSPPTLEQLITEYCDLMMEAIGTGRVTLRRSSDATPFGLTIAESGSDTVLEVQIHGSDGLRGIIVNDTAAAITWATTHYRRVWNEATLVQTPQ